MRNFVVVVLVVGGRQYETRETPIPFSGLVLQESYKVQQPLQRARGKASSFLRGDSVHLEQEMKVLRRNEHEFQKAVWKGPRNWDWV